MKKSDQAGIRWFRTKKLLTGVLTGDGGIIDTSRRPCVLLCGCVYAAVSILVFPLRLDYDSRAVFAGRWAFSIGIRSAYTWHFRTCTGIGR